MSPEQCWSRLPNDSRCLQPAVPGGHFCEGHNRPGRHPLSVWRATEAETPPDLVAAIRAYCPDFVFAPAPVPPPVAAPSPAGAPAALDGSGLLGLVVAGPDEPARSPESPHVLHGADLPPAPSPSVSPCLRVDADPAPMDWFLTMLQEAMTGVMAGEATPLQKANAVARLGGLYLKACGAAERERTSKELEARVADLEARLAAMEARNSEPPVPGTAEPRARTGPGSPPRSEGMSASSQGGESPEPAGGPAELFLVGPANGRLAVSLAAPGEADDADDQGPHAAPRGGRAAEPAPCTAPLKQERQAPLGTCPFIT